MIENLYKFWSLLNSHQKRKGILVFCLMLIGIGLDIIGVGLILPLITILTQSDGLTNEAWMVRLFELLGNPDREVFLLGLLVFMVIFYLLKNLYLIWMIFLQSHYTIRFGELVAHRLFESYIFQPYTFHLQRNSSELIRNIVNEARAIGTLSMSLLTLVGELLIVLGLVVMLLYFSSGVVFISMLLLGVGGALFYKLIKTKMEKWGKERQFHEGKRIQQVQQGLGGVKEAKVLGRESEFIKRFSYHNVLYSKFLRNYRISSQLPRLWNEWVAVLGLLTVVSLSLAQGEQWGAILPLLGIFTAATFRLTPSVNRILIALQSLHYNFPVIDIIKKELDISPVDTLNHNVEKSIFTRSIELTSVKYGYPESEEDVLMDVNLKITCGQTVGFIGASGSGKSTLIDVILGLLTPTNGEVLVDDENIQDNLINWQSNIGYVPQTVCLIDESLRSNIAFGVNEQCIDDERINASIKDAQIDEFVKSLPDGLDTVIGEQGVRLSGGQRQRIGIARALYHNPDVLVFDEATSSLDSNTESEVMNTIRKLKGERTILIIAHRLSTLDSCDVVFEVSKKQGIRVAQHH